jgi:hypothetical protein
MRILLGPLLQRRLVAPILLEDPGNKDIYGRSRGVRNDHDQAASYSNWRGGPMPTTPPARLILDTFL